jgi:NADP-dependent 3-hydroxy acid dehydrogenase YdfG
VSDKVFLITGASSGIGAATARAAADAGYRLVLAARSEDKLEALANACGGGSKAVYVVTDVTRWDDNERLAATALEAFGRIDVAFVNAGFGAARGFHPDKADPPEHWRDMVLTNVLGAAYTIRATLPAILESTGHVLITGSVAGRVALPGSLYSSTKWAITGMGQSLRGEVAGTGVRVTLIEPGMVDTPFFDNRPQSGALADVDIANAVMYAVQQPAHVDVSELLVRPAQQQV